MFGAREGQRQSPFFSNLPPPLGQGRAGGILAPSPLHPPERFQNLNDGEYFISWCTPNDKFFLLFCSTLNNMIALYPNSSTH